MKAAIITAVHGRVPVTKVWWEGINRIVDQWDGFEIEAQVYMAGNEVEQRELCESVGGVWIEAENQPLGHKWNMALARVPGDTDYFFITGDDDFYSPKLVQQYGAHMILGAQYVAMHGAYFYEPATDRAMWFKGLPPKRPANYHPYLPEFQRNVVPPISLRTAEWKERQRIRKEHQQKIIYPIGAGRLLHRSLVESTGWALWHDEVPRGLDGSMNLKLGPVQPTLLSCTQDSFVLDVKTDVNMWTFDQLLEKTNLYEARGKSNGAEYLESHEWFAVLPEWADICALA